MRRAIEPKIMTVSKRMISSSLLQVVVDQQRYYYSLYACSNSRRHWLESFTIKTKTSKKSRSSSLVSPSVTPPPSPLPLLHYEWIQPKKSLIQAEDDVPNDTEKESPIIVFLHGLLGNLRNIKTMANKVCQLKQKHGLLIDLPGHGKSHNNHKLVKHRMNDQKESTGMENINNVTFDTTVEQIHATILSAINNNKDAKQQLNDVSSLPSEVSDSTTRIALVGHSLGGRLSLHYASRGFDPKPDHVWLLDTVPGKVDTSVYHVLHTAEEVRNEFINNLTSSRPHTKKEFTQKLINPPHSLKEATAHWLAASYDTKTGEFSFDLDTAENFVRGIQQQDFVHEVQRLLLSNNDTSVHLIQGGQNAAWQSPKIEQSIRKLCTSSMENSKFTNHILPNAGHWVHIDDLPGLLKAFKAIPF